MAAPKQTDEENRKMHELHAQWNRTMDGLFEEANPALVQPWGDVKADEAAGRISRRAEQWYRENVFGEDPPVRKETELGDKPAETAPSEPDEFDANAQARRKALGAWYVGLYRAIAPSQALFEKFAALSLEDQASVSLDGGMLVRARAAFEAVIDRRALTRSTHVLAQDETPTVAARRVLDTFFGRILVGVSAMTDVRTVQGTLGPTPAKLELHKNGMPVIFNEVLYVNTSVEFTLGPDIAEKAGQDRVNSLWPDEAKELPTRAYTVGFVGSVRVRRDEDGEVEMYELLHARGTETLTRAKVMEPQKVKMLIDDLLRAFNVPPEAIAELNQVRTHWGR